MKIVDKLPDDYKKLHLYHFKDLLRPRSGRAEKESLSLYILEKLESTFNSWTDKNYADSKSEVEVLRQLRKNLEEEANIAWSLFLDKISNIDYNQLDTE